MLTTGPPRQEKGVPNHVVVEVRGGVVVEVYSDVADLRVSILDWDEIAAAPAPPSTVPSRAASALADIPVVTRKQLALDTE